MTLMSELLDMSEGIESGNTKDGLCPGCDRPLGWESIKANSKLCPVCTSLKKKSVAESPDEDAKKMYDDSAEFTDELMNAGDLLDKFDGIVSADKFRAWLKITDTNFGTDTEGKLDDLFETLRDLHDKWNDLTEELDDAA